MGIAVTLFCKRLKDSKTQMQSQDFSIKFLTEVLMGRRDMVYIACPYYIGIRNYDYKPHILCEGISGEEATRLPFDDVKSRAKYMMEHCYKIHRCKLCHIHKELNRKYGVTDEI
jgi:hypothetical protein